MTFLLTLISLGVIRSCRSSRGKKKSGWVLLVNLFGGIVSDMRFLSGKLPRV